MMAQNDKYINIKTDNSGTVKPLTIFSVVIAIIGLLFTAAIQPIHNEIDKIEASAEYLKTKVDRHMEDGHSLSCFKIERRMEQLEQALYQQRGNGK